MDVTPPPVQSVVLEGDGHISEPWRIFLNQLWRRTGGTIDLIAQALVSFVPLTARVNAGMGLNGGGDFTADIAISFYRYKGSYSGLAALTEPTMGDWAYVTNARNTGEGAGVGTGAPCYFNGTIWRIPGVATAVTA